MAWRTECISSKIIDTSTSFIYLSTHSQAQHLHPNVLFFPFLSRQHATAWAPSWAITATRSLRKVLRPTPVGLACSIPFCWDLGGRWLICNTNGSRKTPT